MHSLPRRSRGLSLLELLVALSIGIFLVGGVVSLFLASKRSYTETDRFSRVAESGRFALVTLGRDLRQAGFFGAAGLANLSTDPDTGAVVGDCTAPADAYGYGTYFRVVRASAAGVAVGCVTDAVPDSDVIIIKAVRAVPLTDGDRDNRADDDGIIDRPEAINNQRTYILANTDRGVLFRGNDGTPPTITAGGDVPQGEAWQYQAFVYYVRNTGNVPTLSRKTLGWNGANMAILTEDLVQGVEQMRVLLGEDRTLDGNVDVLVDSTAVIDWTRVLSAQPSLLLRSLETEPGYVDDRTYVLAGASFTPGGAFRRLVISETVSMRNSIFQVRSGF